MQDSSDGHKRSRPRTDYLSCLICQRSSDETLQRLTEQGYASLLNAVQKRDDEVSLRLQDDVLDKEHFLSMSPLCHAKCRNAYTNKKTVEQRCRAKIRKREQAENLQEPQQHNPQILTRSAGSTIKLKEECFVCRKARDKKGNWTLVLVRTLDRQNSVWSKAKELQDDNMLRELQGFGETCVDMIANDFRYHKTCLDAYMNQTASKTCTKLPNVFEQGLTWLVSQIDDTFSRNKDSVLFLTELRDQYRQWLSEHGVENAMAYRSASLRERIRNYYDSPQGCQIMIFPRKGASSIVCSKDLSIGVLLAEVAKKTQVSVESDDEDGDANLDTEVASIPLSYSYHSAKFLQAEIKENAKAEREHLKSAMSTHVDTGCTTGEQSMEISYAEALRRTGTNLYNHMAWLLTGAGAETNDEGRVELSAKQHEQVLNISQDICSALSGIPTPKHVGTALHVLKQTRSKETITLLNRLGHSISYQNAQRYIATIAEANADQTTEDGFFTPSQLKPGRLTHFAVDNLDFQENTKDGTTMHGTTHAIYQYPNLDEQQSTANVSVPLVKTRSSCHVNVDTFTTTDCGLTLKDRQRGRALAGVELQIKPSEKPIDFHPNTLWLLIGMDCNNDATSEESNTHLTWNAFHKSLMEDDPQRARATVIGYGPFFPESPTKPDVVQASLDYCMKVSQKLGQQHCVVTCDQAIYEIALGLQKKDPDKFNTLVLRMGGFHIACNFMGAIGHFMKSSGIEDVLVEAGVCGPGTANKYMAGTDYYGMLRAHSLVLAALFQLHWNTFEQWLIQESDQDTSDLEFIALIRARAANIATAISASDRNAAQTHCREMLELEDRMNDLLTNYHNKACSSPTAKLWLMYMDMVQILKRYIHAERAGLWESHLTETENMLPYLVSAGHHKYVSCVPHYLDAMKKLPENAPEIDEGFKSGKFTVRQLPGCFNGVWSDMALEQTYNCEAKNHLFQGITQQPQTIDKYLKALPVMTTVSEQVKSMVHMNANTTDKSKETAQKETSMVKEIMTVIENKMINPFKPDIDGLVNIASGQKSNALDLPKAKQIGLAVLSKAQRDGSSTVGNVKLATFVERTRKAQSVAQKAKKVYEDESSVIRHLYFLQNMDNDQKVETFSHEWTSYPSSLFEPDPALPCGYGMRKGNKADFVIGIQKELGESWIEKDQMPTSTHSSHFIIDMMAFIHHYRNVDCTTFEELQQKYLTILLATKPTNCDSISVVGDRYDVDSSKSLKLEERMKRDKPAGPGKTYDIQDRLPIPQWKNFIAHHPNKAALLNFIATSWMKNAHLLPQGFKLVLGGMLRDPGKTVLVSTTETTVVPELCCSSHEEADTRIFCHLLYAVQKFGCQKAVIQATDSDVILMGVYHAVRITGLQELWIRKANKFLACHEIAENIAVRHELPPLLITSVMLSVYILTGCDTVSYPYRRGKKRAFDLAMLHTEKLRPIADYGTSGTSLTVTTDVIDSARFFFIRLYTTHDFEGNLDALRAHMFATTKGDLRSLPPTESAFHFHVLRALHQIALSKRAHESDPDLPNALTHGRKLHGGILVPIMMDKNAKPNITKQTKYCGCRKNRCQRGCICARANVKCVIACRCAADPRLCSRVLGDTDSD